MSRWTLLKDSLTKRRNPQNTESIHNNQHKYSYAPSSLRLWKVIWTGFSKKVTLEVSVNVDTVIQECIAHFALIDSPEYTLHLAFDETNEHHSSHINDIRQKLDVASVVTTVIPSVSSFTYTLLLTHPSYTPYMKTYTICTYSIQYHTHAYTVYTREQTAQRRITVRELQSHVLHQVDNT
ncbi:hypothetical protein EON63_19345, partial [archaeon]